MFKKKKTSQLGFGAGVLLGGLLGGIAGLLFAPKSGRELREDLTDQYQRVTEEAHELMDSVCTHSMDMIERAKEIAEETKEAASKFLDQEEKQE